MCIFHPDNAYGKTLRQYHGWVVRGVFAVSISYSHHYFSPLRSIRSCIVTVTCLGFPQLALRAAPSYQSFSAALVSTEGEEKKSGFTRGMHRDLGVYLPAMERQLGILDVLYEEYNLESDEVVWKHEQRNDPTSRKDRTWLQGSGWLLKEGAWCIKSISCTKWCEHVPYQCEVFPVAVKLYDSGGSRFEEGINVCI